MMKKRIDEKIIRNILIILTLISLIITIINFTYQVYENLNITNINKFLTNYINTWLMWIDNTLLYIFAFIYIILGIKSKKEVVLKISFCIFSIMTSIIFLTFIVNLLAKTFGMFN